MRDRQSTLRRILDSGIVAVMRARSSEHLIGVADAIRAGGVDCIEVTMTTPNALGIIEQTARTFGDDAVIGVGTVLDAESARAAILAGAQFIVAPTLNLDVIRMAHRYDKAVIPGAFTPTEILTAWENGADLVKVFPAGRLGPEFFRDMQGPLPQVKLVPTGGVDLTTAEDFIRCGAAALCVGTAMTPKDAMASGRLEVVTDLAAQFVAAVKRARGQA